MQMDSGLIRMKPATLDVVMSGSAKKGDVLGIARIAAIMAAKPDFMFGAIFDPRFGSLVTCVGLFLVPTVFAGMVSPYAIRIIVKNRESSGHDAGYLYFISTIGSSLGTLLTAFYLVLLFEVNTILLVAIGISLGLAGLGAAANYRKE